LVLVSLSLVLTSCGTNATTDVTCDNGDTLILSAQAVPEATMLPCVVGFPTGWTSGGYVAKTGDVRFWMDHDRAGAHAVQVMLSSGCDVSTAESLGPAATSPDADLFEARDMLSPPSGKRFFVFEGGCVTLGYDFSDDVGIELLDEGQASLMLVPRSALVSKVAERGVVLCGAGAPACD
jgi:hypothetical protein